MKVARDLLVAFLFLVVFSAMMLLVLPQGLWVTSVVFLGFGIESLCLTIWSQNRGHEFFFEPVLRRRPLLVTPALIAVWLTTFFAVTNVMVVWYEQTVGHPYPGCTAFTTGFWKYF